jgi:hypothetical protein
LIGEFVADANQVQRSKQALEDYHEEVTIMKDEQTDKKAVEEELQWKSIPISSYWYYFGAAGNFGGILYFILIAGNAAIYICQYFILSP